MKMFEVTHHFHYRLLTLLLRNQVIQNYLSIVTTPIEWGGGGKEAREEEGAGVVWEL